MARSKELAPRTDERYISRDVDMTPISGLFDDIVPVLIQCRLPSISGISKKLQCCGQIFQKYRKSYNVGWHIFQEYRKSYNVSWHIFQKYRKSYIVGWHIFQKYYSVVTPMPKLVSLIYALGDEISLNIKHNGAETHICFDALYFLSLHGRLGQSNYPIYLDYDG